MFPDPTIATAVFGKGVSDVTVSTVPSWRAQGNGSVRFTRTHPVSTHAE